MNILFLNSATEWGGNEKWSLAAARGFAGRGHRVFFGCRSPLFQERAGETKISFVRFPFLNHTDLFTLAALLLFLRRNRVDVLVPTKQREYLLGGLAAFPLKTVKVVARLGIDRPLHNARNRFAFKRLFDGVIVNSKSIVPALGRTPGFDTRICRVISNGVAIPPLAPEARRVIRQKFNVSDKEFLICGIGRLASQKGFDFAIEAFAKLCGKTPRARLMIVGEGPLLDDYKKLADARTVAGRIIFTGFRDDTTGILQAADLFWLTSRSEGMSNVLLEAMAAGKAAVAFDVAGVREVIQDGINGRIVAPGDVVALADYTMELIDDERALERMAAAARRTMEKDFSVEKMVDGVEKYLQELCRMTTAGKE